MRVMLMFNLAPGVLLLMLSLYLRAIHHHTILPSVLFYFCIFQNAIVPRSVICELQVLMRDHRY